MAETAEETPQAAAPPKRKAGPGRPKAEHAAAHKTANATKFFDSLANIEKDDWGTRKALYLYRLEPFTDRKRSGDHIYLVQYTEPVNENRVMADYGSGRYRLMLTAKKQVGGGGDEVGRYEFEILNYDHPPKIGPGEWVDDPRNKKWAWAKPQIKEPAAPAVQPQSSVSALREVLEVNEMLNEQAAARIPEPPPQKSATDELTGVLSIARGLMDIAGPNKGDAVLGVMQTQLEMMQRSMEAKDTRIERLIDELRRKPEGPPVVDPLDQMLATMEKYDRLRDKMQPEPKPEPQRDNPSRNSRMPWWAEALIGPATELVKGVAPLLPALMNRTAPQPPQQPNPMQRPAPQPPPQIQANPDVVAFMDFLSTQTIQMLTFCFDNEAPGGDFAEWLYQASNIGDDGHPLWIHPQSAMKVPWLKTMHDIGIEKLLDIYKQSQFWGAVALKENGEATFKKFLEELIAWAPPKDDETEPENFFPTSEVIE